MFIARQLMNLKILTVILLFSIAQAINPFEGGFSREKCLKGRRLTGCKETLLEAYKRTNLSESDQNINKADTYILLFTRRNKENPEYLDECGGSLPRNTYFNPKRNVEVIVHGFLESVCQVAWMREMKDQLLYRGDYNVILIDYSWGNQVDYFDAARNGEIVGKQIAFTLKNIVDKTGISPDKFHIIGHSLGSHVAGTAGHYFLKLAGKLLRRITGLDPAGPGFQDTPLGHVLDKTDAQLVDNIHTNAGPCLPVSFGLEKPLGHLDFYPNGGSIQLSCIAYILISFIKGDINYAAGSLVLPLCYHKQSVQYYKNSINACDCQFTGIKCDNYKDFKSGKCKSCGKDGSNCAVMGMDAEDYTWTEGNNTYYLDTSMVCPYCDNKLINLDGFPRLPPGKGKPKCFSKKSGILPNIG